MFGGTTNSGNEFKLRRSSRKIGAPQFYGKRLNIDIIDVKDDQPGSALNPISLDEDEQTGSIANFNIQIPSDKKTPLYTIHSAENQASASDSSSLDSFSLSSTDQSLREAVNSYNEVDDLDSELFNAELEKFIEDEKLPN